MRLPPAESDSSSGAHNLPMAILAIRFDLRPRRQAEIFGFLYFSGSVPADLQARRNFTWNLLNGDCCQLKLRGSNAQIESLLRVAAVSSGWSFSNNLGIAGCIQAAKEHGLSFGFDNLEEPSGRGLPIQGPLCLAQSEREIAQRLENLGDELELSLAEGWRPEEWLED